MREWAAGHVAVSRGGSVADGCTGRCAEEGSGTINSVGLIVVAVALAVGDADPEDVAIEATKAAPMA